MPTPPQYISTSRAAERLGLSREHVRRLIQRGELRAEERVSGFMLDTAEVEQYAFQRQVLKDHQQFRAAVDDLAAQGRHVDGAKGVQSAVAQIRDQMKRHSAFEVPAVVAPQMTLIEQEIAAQKALISLTGPVATMAEQWRRYDEHARRVAENITTTQADYGARFVSAMDHAAEKTSAAHMASGAKVIGATEESVSKAQGQANGGISARSEMQKGENIDKQRATAGQQDVYSGQSGGVGLSDTGAAMDNAMLKRQEDRFVTLMRKDDPLATASLAAPRLPELARGFVVAESREMRLEEKMDELDRKVQQLTELVMQQHADTATEMPTWQQWAESDRPEDVLAKLAAVREAITGGKQIGENSTDVIRAAREARGRGE